jgi:hypothetical protein
MGVVKVPAQHGEDVSCRDELSESDRVGSIEQATFTEKEHRVMEPDDRGYIGMLHQLSD